MLKRLIFWITLGFLQLETISGQISCYQCNVDPSSRFTRDCADPYVPSPSDQLLPCPQDEPHHCLKAVVLYNHNDVTVRGCVPSRLRDSYCADSNFINFSDAEVGCRFCETDACNHSTSRAEPYANLVLGLVAVVVVNF